MASEGLGEWWKPLRQQFDCPEYTHKKFGAGARVVKGAGVVDVCMVTSVAVESTSLGELFAFSMRFLQHITHSVTQQYK